MAYTVQKLAKLSGVSVRTLHHYDEIELLKPAYHGANGYRYYEEEQLLLLQQILFFRKLGFELQKIRDVVRKNDFDKLAALHLHRKALMNGLNETHELIETIDKTINHLQGKKKMKDREIYGGFLTAEKQAEYKQYLINQLGDKAKNSIEASEEKMKNWTQAEWNKFSQEWDAICKDLAALFAKSLKPDSAEVQAVIRRHHKWLPWTGETCTREAYIGLGQGYTGFEWKKAFAPYDSEHPRLAQFLAEGMKVFAVKELS